jgi:hypothetical protein
MQSKRNGFTDEELLLMTLLGGAVLWLGGCGGSSRQTLQADLALTHSDDANTLASQLTRLYPHAKLLPNPSISRSRPTRVPRF